MVRLLILLAAVSPPLLILGYGIAKARGSWNSEAMWNAFAIGAVSAIAALGCELGLQYLLQLGRLPPIAESAAKAVAVAAIPEESIKFFVLVSLASRHVDVRRLQDIVILALAVSLGFAALENFFYVISVGGWKVTAAVRAITAIPGHGIDGLAMGALLIAASLNGNARPWRFQYALLVPIALHAAYDFPLMAMQKSIGSDWFIGAWLVVLALSSILVIRLCNRVLPRAVEADRVSGCDGESVETTDRLIAGGIVALVGGPLLGGIVFYAHGYGAGAAAAMILGIFPVAFGIDAIRTGLKRRRARLAASRPAFDYAQ
jgi:RsiW-degrading membrane proteinase PrsW (M82 family)